MTPTNAMREALELIATPMRPDGTWNRDREACRALAAEALHRPDDADDDKGSDERQAKLENDAARYRWLRDCGSLTWVPFRSQWKMDAEHCDAAIDNEMATQRMLGAA